MSTKKEVKTKTTLSKEEEPKAVVLVACPNNSGMRHEYCANSMFSMGWFAAANGIKAASYTFDEHPISVARNAAMEALIKNEKFTHIFFIDSDVVTPPDILSRLVNFDVPIVSGWYLNRKGTGVPLVFKLAEACPTQMPNETGRFPAFKPYQVQDLLLLPKDKTTGLTQIDGVGMGCMLIRRDALGKKDSPTLSKPFFYEDPINFRGFGEDLWFALNCKIHSVPIYLDSNSFCAHVAWGLIDMRHVQAILKRAQQAAQASRGIIKKEPM